MIICKSCEQIIISKIEQTIWRKCSVTQNRKQIPDFIECLGQKTETFSPIFWF